MSMKRMESWYLGFNMIQKIKLIFSPGDLEHQMAIQSNNVEVFMFLIQIIMIDFVNLIILHFVR
jgi:hypothetical protein